MTIRPTQTTPREQPHELVDADGKVIGEITPRDAGIDWRWHAKIRVGGNLDLIQG